MHHAPVHRPEKTYTRAHDFVPEAGKPVALGHGLWWLRMPLPMDLNHINLWLMESVTGWTVVDTGFNYPETKTLWDNVFAGTMAGKPVDEIFITHFHPDHFGLAGWLADRTHAPVRITRGEYDMIRTLTDPARHGELETLYAAHYRAAGVDDAMTGQLLEKRFLYQRIVTPLPSAPDFVSASENIVLGGRPWRIIGGNGHCPDHACLYHPEHRIFISGDIVLPDISPNISFFPGNPPEHDPVSDYLSTLDRLLDEIPDDVTVLPSHGVPFKGLHRRIEELKAHHQRRFEKLHAVCRHKPQTAFEIMESLFSHRKLKPSDLFFALGETLAHIVHEEKSGRLRRTTSNGQDRYVSAA